MIVYHGSYIEVRKPKILNNEKARDFGFAFYVTTIKEQAEKMAIRKFRQMRIVGESSKPIVSIFEYDENCSDLLCKELLKADIEWLNLVVACRSNINYQHGYDIVKGKIADDKVGETVGLVMDKTIAPEQAIEKLKFQKINDQIAFCTEKSLNKLKFLKSYEVTLK